MHRGSSFRRCAGLLLAWMIAGCGEPAGSGPKAQPKSGPPAAESLRDEIPPDQLIAVIDAHYRGLGAMERYEYRAAAEAFRDVHARAPGWIAGTINLSIALLNLGGEGVEDAKKSGQANVGEASDPNIVTARKLLDGVIRRDPNQPYALFSRGIILQSQGETIAAHADFERVTQIDAHDGHTWYEFGETLTDPTRSGMPAGREQAPELVAAYTKALEANPYLVTAMYKLQQAYGLTGNLEQKGKTLALWAKLNPKRNAAAAGEEAKLTYGEMGKYAQIIDPFRQTRPAADRAPSPRFGPADLIQLTLPAGDRWATPADLVGPQAAIGRAQQRFGAGIATFDVNRDGRLDLYLTAAVVGGQGLRDALLINQGDGRFTDATADYRLPLDRASLGVAASDFDADLQVDLYLTGINNNRLFRLDGKHYVDITQAAGVAIEGAISLTARWFDIDQDGDLDLYVLNHAPASDLETAFVPGASGKGFANSVFRNDGKPAPIGQRPEDNWAPLAVATADLPARQGLSVAFSTAWPSSTVLQAGANRHSGFGALDIDNDRDIDFVVTADDQPPTVFLNDRGGSFHTSTLAGWQVSGTASGLLVTDFNKDGLPDLVAAVAGGPAFAWQNQTERSATGLTIRGSSFPMNAANWRLAQLADLDLDTWPDLIGLDDAAETAAPRWARNAVTRYETQPLAFGPIGDRPLPVIALSAATLVGDALPDIVFRRPGEPPRIAANRGNGSHWLAIDLSGRWKTSHDQMRTNSEGLGARLSLEGQGLLAPIDYTTIQTGLAQSVGPVVLGMGSHLSAPLLRTRWPDGVMQSELNVTADKELNLVELSRKTGSCPILFTWNGEKFLCLGDFAGAAGLGFLEAPGEYHPPDRDEALAITSDQLQAVGQTYRLSVVEPMDEIAYLDRLELEVIDRPPGVTTTPDERFAFGNSRPSGELLAWEHAVPPTRATDHCGRDVLDLVMTTDRRTVDRFAKIDGRIGYTQDHALTLDFGSTWQQGSLGCDPYLCLTGWVEYPYSQTNYAAAGSGSMLTPPILEQRLANGDWRTIDPAMGHPAGLTRTMAVNLAGKLAATPDLVLRIRTNMECYWDQAQIVLADPKLKKSVRTTTLPVAQARLRDRGYLRESAPDGRQPALPDYDHVDPMPLARFQGELTRHGDVTPLLRSDDDQLCVIGPGDEVQLEFRGDNLPTLESGWTRSFVFRSVAYCKDADPFTATSDTVGPLPWQGMKAFPFPAGGERPSEPAYDAYLREYQTRPAGMR